MPRATLDDATTVSRREDVIAERVLDETVILDPQSDSCIRLNAPVCSLWEAPSRDRTVQALAEGLAGEFGLEAARARADVSMFVGDLVERGLLEIVR